MGETGITLVSFCRQRPLDVLLCGIASKLGVQYRAASDLEEATGILGSSSPVILVIGLDPVDDTGLAMIRELSSKTAGFTLCVVDTLNDSEACVILKSGAIACMNSVVAMESLVSVVENVYRRLVAMSTGEAPLRREITLGDSLILSVPDYKVTDGEFETRLTATPGRLLECLATHPGQVLPFQTLLQAAWKKRDQTTHAALHQQIHVLEEALDVYGALDWIQCRRGIGYIFDSATPRICP